jgi:hypothetical protein
VHPGDRRLDGEEDAAHVHVEHQVEILEREDLDQCAAKDAGVDHSDVERAETLDRLCDGVSDRDRIRAVGPDGNGPAVDVLDRGDQIARPVGSRDVGQRDIEAVLGEA